MEQNNIVITTSTASGKTLSFLLPVLQEILSNPLARAIFIYPTKALASDQYRAILPYLGFFGENRISAGVYNGDTPVNERSRIRKNANIILTNPEMLNAAFLPNHSKFGFDFIYSNLKYKDYGVRITETIAGKIVKEQYSDKSGLFAKMQEFAYKCSEIMKSDEIYNYFEFDKYSLGVNYGLIPLQTRAMDEEEEERRLFFVGITRAKDYLELSYYTNPDYFRAMPGENRYIHMIPQQLIQDASVKSAAVNLQELKKQIQEAKTEIKKEELSVESVNQISPKQVSHKKYGTGIVLKEYEMMIEVEFENYGVKEFIKAFSELEFL